MNYLHSLKLSNHRAVRLLQTSAILQIILGSIFMGIMAQIAIPLPFTVVPMTLQTLAVAILAITLGSTKAPLAVGTYLIQATMGLPVIAGGTSNPLWMTGPRAGYLIGFLAASYVVAKLLERQKNPSFINSWLVLTLNEGTVLLIGTLWLSLYVGLENGFLMGALPFLPGAFVKITVAALSVKPIGWIKSL